MATRERERESNRIERTERMERMRNGLVSAGPGKSQGPHRPADSGRGKIPFSSVSFIHQPCPKIVKEINLARMSPS
jgi:hypothetical protein